MNPLNFNTIKKRNLIIATLLVVVAALVAFVSCKKESQDTLLNNNQPVKAFTVPQVDDMNSFYQHSFYYYYHDLHVDYGRTLTMD